MAWSGLEWMLPIANVADSDDGQAQVCEKAFEKIANHKHTLFEKVSLVFDFRPGHKAENDRKWISLLCN